MVAPDDPEGRKAVRVAWAELIKGDRDTIPRLYDVYFASVARLLGRPVADGALEGLDAYRFVLTFASGSYLRGGKPEAWNVLERRHPEHRALIEAAQQHPDDRFTDTPLPSSTGTWGDIAGAMLELYEWHAPYTGEAEQLQAEVASLVPTHFRAFPAQDQFVLVKLLAVHPEAVREVSELIRFYLLERQQADEGPMGILAADMLGFHARKDDVLHVRSPEIFAQVLRDIEQWPDATVDAFVEGFVCHPLRIETVTREGAAEAKRRSILGVRNSIDPSRGHASDGEWAQQHLASLERELALIEGDFEAWQTQRRRAAVQRIAVSAGTRKALTIVAGRLPADQGTRVTALLEEAAEYRSRPKRFPLPAPKDNRFKDFGLKLLVVEELMYRQRVLEPRFDIYEFVQEYDKREISVDKDGYAIIPEVERYFRNLPISDELLARVESLHQSSGLDGGSEFLTHLFPFWDPGSGDEVIPVTNKAVADLELLPNLARISGLENSEPSAKLRKSLTGRGIELVEEELSDTSA